MKPGAGRNRGQSSAYTAVVMVLVIIAVVVGIPAMANSGGGNDNACPVVPPNVTSIPPGIPITSSASVSSIPYGQSEPVTFTYNAPGIINNYVLYYWIINGVPYANNNVTITETLTCASPGQVLTGPSGTASYIYVPPGSGLGIFPDVLEPTQPSNIYVFFWSSSWSGPGTLTWNVSGVAYIYYPGIVLPFLFWSAKVTMLSIVEGVVTAAGGGGSLLLWEYPIPPRSYVIICEVNSGGVVNVTDVSIGRVVVTIPITCYFELNRL